MSRTETTPHTSRRLGLSAATALVVANMIGTGIFTTTGFMASDLAPDAILVAWLLGGLLALCGATAYAELGTLMPRVGGEYVYLREAFHPALGFVAGWISLFVGFSAPIAAAAIAFGAYLQALVPSLSVSTAAVGLIALSTLVHVRSVALGNRLQTAFTILKIGLIVGFVALGLFDGDADWTRLRAAPEGASSSWLAPAFWTSLVYVSFSYTGWNAAGYIAGEIHDPGRNVPRALLLGTVIVTALYLLLNVVMLVSAPAETLAGKPEVAYVAATQLFGEGASRWLSALIAIGLAPTVGAMIFAGPRVYAAMAEDGLFFPRFARRGAGGAPVESVVLQGALAAAFALFVPFESLLQYAGFTLSLVSALTVVGVAVLRRKRPDAPRPHRTLGWPVTPVVFVVFSLWMAFHLIREEPLVCLAGGGTTVGTGLVAYLAWSRRAGGGGTPARRVPGP